MTLKELNQYKSICEEITETNTSLSDNTVCSTVKGSDKVFPYISHSMSVGGIVPTQDNSKRIIKLRTLERKKRDIEIFIEEIDDSLTRRIFVMRFIKGYSWNKIAVKTRNAEAGVKMICYRYIKNQRKN